MAITVKRKSQISGKINSMVINTTQEKFDIYEEEKANLHVQDAFPELSADEREFIMTGITPEEWEKTFKEDV